jgi:CubicO group peptidase (beta-lactamase class C family)
MLNIIEIESNITSILRKKQAPSVAIILASNDDTKVITKGIRKYGEPTPIGENDIFMVGPMSSTLVPVLLTRLIEKNLISWESTLNELLPQYEMHPNHRNTTIEMLSTHMTGITKKFPELDGGSLFSETVDCDGHEGRRTTLVSALQTPPDQPIAPYRNAVNLMIIAYIVENVTERTWEQNIEDEVFKPFMFMNSGVGIPSQFQSSPYPHESGPIPLTRKTEWLDCQATFPSLGVYSTLQEIGVYLQWCMRGLNEKKKLFQLENGNFTPGGFDLFNPTWSDSALRCAGHVSGFSTGIWISNHLAFAIFVNVDGVEGSLTRDEVYRVLDVHLSSKSKSTG